MCSVERVFAYLISQQRRTVVSQHHSHVILKHLFLPQKKKKPPKSATQTNSFLSESNARHDLSPGWDNEK